MAPARNARERSTRNIIVSGEIFFSEGENGGGDHPNVLQYKGLQLTTQYAYIHFRNPMRMTCGGGVHFRIRIAKDGDADGTMTFAPPLRMMIVHGPPALPNR
jgi:hypothetical protein